MKQDTDVPTVYIVGVVVRSTCCAICGGGVPAGVEAELLKEAFPKKLAAVSVDEPLRAKVGGALVAISVGKVSQRYRAVGLLLSCVVWLSYSFISFYRLCIINILLRMECYMFYTDVLEAAR